MKYPLGEELILDKKGKTKKKEKMLLARREEALRICEAGLKDPFTHLSEHKFLHNSVVSAKVS
jgi:hypothetical protein